MPSKSCLSHEFKHPTLTSKAKVVREQMRPLESFEYVANEPGKFAEEEVREAMCSCARESGAWSGHGMLVEPWV